MSPVADRDSTIRRKAWATWLGHQLAQRDWRPADLIVASDKRLTSSQVSRWLTATTGPDIDGLRHVARALRVPVLEAMVAANYLTQDEAGVTVVETERSLSDFTVGELLSELGTRYHVERTIESGAPEVPDGAYRWPTSTAPSARRAHGRETSQQDSRMEQ